MKKNAGKILLEQFEGVVGGRGRTSTGGGELVIIGEESADARRRGGIDLGIGRRSGTGDHGVEQQEFDDTVSTVGHLSALGEVVFGHSRTESRGFETSPRDISYSKNYVPELDGTETSFPL